MSAVPARTRVWSAAVRCLHAALAAAVLGALWLHEGGAWHEGLGYAALVASAARLLYGVPMVPHFFIQIAKFFVEYRVFWIFRYLYY